MSPSRLRLASRELKRDLKDGQELAFSPIWTDGEKRLSHTIRRERGRYIVSDAAGVELGRFHTFRRADREGLAASRPSDHSRA